MTQILYRTGFAAIRCFSGTTLAIQVGLSGLLANFARYAVTILYNTFEAGVFYATLSLHHREFTMFFQFRHEFCFICFETHLRTTRRCATTLNRISGTEAWRTVGGTPPAYRGGAPKPARHHGPTQVTDVLEKPFGGWDMAEHDASSRDMPATIKRTARLLALAVLSIGSASASSMPVMTGLELWLDASTLAASTTSVTTWADQSGNGRDATAAGSAPAYVASNALFSNRPTVSFDGGGYLDSALASTMGITGSSPRTIFFAFSQDSAIARNILGYGANAGNALFDIAAANRKISGHFYGGPFQNGSQQFSVNTMTVGTAQYDGATFKTYQDNVLASSSAHTLATGNSE